MTGYYHPGAVLSFFVGLFWIAVGIPHAHWKFDPESGFIMLKEKPELHLNVQGGEVDAGKPIVIWHTQSQRHEMFEHVDGQLRSQYQPGLCLNAEGGPNVGAAIVMWPCGKHEDTSVVEHEQFDIDSTGRIKLKAKPDMCLNVKGGALNSGTELVLWLCQGNDNERFKIEDGMIKLQTDDKLHLNIASGQVVEGAKVVLYHTHGGAHEIFEFARIDQGVAKGQMSIRLANDPTYCLNAKGGLNLGAPLVLWPCAGDKNEAFQYNEADGTISAIFRPELGFNAAGGGMQPGDAVVLYPLGPLGQKREL